MKSLKTIFSFWRTWLYASGAALLFGIRLAVGETPVQALDLLSPVIWALIAVAWALCYELQVRKTAMVESALTEKIDNTTREVEKLLRQGGNVQISRKVTPTKDGLVEETVMKGEILPAGGKPLDSVKSSFQG